MSKLCNQATTIRSGLKILFVLLLSIIPAARAQTIFGSLTGGAGVVLEQRNGQVREINTGLEMSNYVSLSRDGRFIVISAPDPQRPNQTSTDLWLHDRINGQTRRLVDNNTEPLIGGGFGLLNPTFSAMAPNNQHVIVTDKRTVTTPSSGSSVTTEITVYRTSDGFPLATGEFGSGNALDLFRAEHVGISWLPNGTAFATPSYVTVNSQLGNPRPVVGIRLFIFNSVSGQAIPSTPLSAPRFFDNVVGLASETHVFPSFSPNGTQLAYFEIFWPNALLTEPVTTTLIVANSDGSNPQRILTFNQGFYPNGLGWTRDGTLLLFSIANQLNLSGSWVAFGDVATAVARSIAPFPGATPSSIAGIGQTIAYLPTAAFLSSVNLSQIPIRLDHQRNGSFMVQAFGLDPSAIYQLQTVSSISDFGTGGQSLTGAQLGAGTAVSTNGPTVFFRLVGDP